MFSGITTNPTLLKQAKQPCTLENIKFLTKEAKKLNCKELHIQAWGENPIDIFNCGIAIGKLASPKMPIYVKIPISEEGVKASSRLRKSNINITFTACFDVKQVLIASAVGASYIAPYLGRMNDEGKDGKLALKNMQKILDKTYSNCKILVASIREVNEITDLASHGIRTFTINSKIAESLLTCDSTKKAVIQFQQDALME